MMKGLEVKTCEEALTWLIEDRAQFSLAIYGHQCMRVDALW